MSVRTRRAVVVLPLVLLAASTAAPAQDGAVVLTSKAPFGMTVAALERAVSERQMTLVCRANAQQGAAARGVRIPGNQVFIIFRNDFAVRLINAEPRAAYEAPIRVYVYENRDGTACIDRLLVTQAGYSRFVAATGHRLPGISRQQYVEQGFLVHDYDREVTPYRWRDAEPPASLADHPVVLVDVRDAEAYCRWRDPRLRLPGEAEWEKAARGRDGRIFPWGNEWEPTRLNSAERGPGGTTPVTRYPAGASPYDVLDAVGNVFQWTATSLPDGRRLLKGCAWDDEAGLCRPAFRHGRPAWSRHILIGFRCAGPPDHPPASGPMR